MSVWKAIILLFANLLLIAGFCQMYQDLCDCRKQLATVESFEKIGYEQITECISVTNQFITQLNECRSLTTNRKNPK